MRMKAFEIGRGDVIKCREGKGKEWKVRNIGRAGNGMIIMHIDDANPGNGGLFGMTIRRDWMTNIECVQANGGETIVDFQKALEDERQKREKEIREMGVVA